MKKIPVIFCQIVVKIEYSRQIFRKILKYQIPRKSVQWEPNVRSGGHEKLIVVVGNVCERD